ncbi:hypothetical protein Tco_1501650 [Tanacetum coccineum]
MYDPQSLEIWSITFPVGLQIQHTEDLTAFALSLNITNYCFCPSSTFTFGLDATVLTCLAVLIDNAALGELYLAALTGTSPDFVATAVGIKFLLGCG